MNIEEAIIQMNMIISDEYYLAGKSEGLEALRMSLAALKTVAWCFEDYAPTYEDEISGHALIRQRQIEVIFGRFLFLLNRKTNEWMEFHK